MGNALTRLWDRMVSKSDPEGSFNTGPYFLQEGYLPEGSPWNFFQMGRDPIAIGRSAIIQACISAYAQTISMCPGSHWRDDGPQGRSRVKNSAITRVLRKPNQYQTPSDFMLNLVSQLFETGNAYALAVRNDRNEITELHLTDSKTSTSRVAVDGSIFYWLAGNPIADAMFGNLNGVPSRNVLHVKLEAKRGWSTSSGPVGMTPLEAVATDRAASDAMIRQALMFHARASRPSGVLSTEQFLTADQTKELRDAWNKQAQGMATGGVPILGGGIKWNPMSNTARDSQLAELMKMTDQNVALAFRIPMQILGIGDTPFASTEALMTSWVSSGLGFAINHIEQAFDHLFKLDGVPYEETDYIEFDTYVLLRSNFLDRVKAYAESVKAGIHARNEGRQEFGLKHVDGGDEPMVQQQDIPLSQVQDLLNAAKEKKTTQPEPTAAPAPPDDSAAKGAELAAQILAMESTLVH